MGEENTSWGLKPSKSNPGYYNINIPNLAILRKLGKAFPDMLKSEWLAQEVQEQGGLTESIGIKCYRDAENRWAGWIWWEDEREGLEIFITRTYQRLSQLEFEVTLEFKIMPKNRRSWTIKKPIKGRRSYQDINAKAEAAWILKRYLDQL